MLYTQPELSHRLLKMITDSTSAYLNAQVKAGADIVQLFDSWAGILSPEQYKEFALPYISQICDAVTDVPVTIFAKGAYFALGEFSKTSCRTIGLDWNMNVEESRKIIGNDKTLQGNLDPCVLYADFKTIEAKTEKMLKAFGPEKHIANLGHGVYPDIDKDKVRCFIDAVKAYRH
jgi:uroporphyrinogen decarboxylase